MVYLQRIWKKPIEVKLNELRKSCTSVLRNSCFKIIKPPEECLLNYPSNCIRKLWCFRWVNTRENRWKTTAFGCEVLIKNATRYVLQKLLRPYQREANTILFQLRWRKLSWGSWYGLLWKVQNLVPLVLHQRDDFSQRVECLSAKRAINSWC